MPCGHANISLPRDLWQAEFPRSSVRAVLSEIIGSKFPRICPGCSLHHADAIYGGMYNYDVIIYRYFYRKPHILRKFSCVCQLARTNLFDTSHDSPTLPIPYPHPFRSTDPFPCQDRLFPNPYPQVKMVAVRSSFRAMVAGAVLLVALGAAPPASAEINIDEDIRQLLEVENVDMVEWASKEASCSSSISLIALIWFGVQKRTQLHWSIYLLWYGPIGYYHAREKPLIIIIG